MPLLSSFEEQPVTAFLISLALAGLRRYCRVGMPRVSRARTLIEIRSIARSHTRTAINVLVGIMRSKDATPAARVLPRTSILDRGWGKTALPLQSGDNDGAHDDSPDRARDCASGGIIGDGGGSRTRSSA